jgi:hypothetical protein
MKHHARRLRTPEANGGLPTTVLALLVSLWAQLNVGSQAVAMVVVNRDFPELAARAEQIVIGTVTAIDQVKDDAGVPATLVTFSDLTVLKGDVGSTLTLRFYGGAADDVVVQVPDMPQFALGERAVLFVAGNGRDICPLVGVWQGRFRVRFDATRNTEVVDSSDGRPVTGVVGRQVRYAPLGATAATPPLTLDEFRQLISDELAAPQADGAPPAAP